MQCDDDAFATPNRDSRRKIESIMPMTCKESVFLRSRNSTSTLEIIETEWRRQCRGELLLLYQSQDKVD